MVREAPLGHDRPAARDDSRHALGRERNVGEPHPGVDREIVNALLGLLDERVAIDVPGQLLGLAADFLQRLVDRHRADGHRRVPENPLAGLVDVLAGREVHDRVGAPARRPRHLVDLLLDRGGDGRVADVGVDLHEELPADDHRLRLGVVDVRRNDRATPRDLVTDELGRHALAQRDVLHLGGDLAAASVVHLADAPAGTRAQRPPHACEPDATERGILLPAPAVRGGRARQLLDVTSAEDPGEPERRQAPLQVEVGGGVGVGTARVVEAERRIAAREPDLPHRHADVGTRPLEVHLLRSRTRLWHTKPPFAGINQVRFMRSATASRPLSPVPRAPAVIEPVLGRRLRRIGPPFKRNASRVTSLAYGRRSATTTRAAGAASGLTTASGPSAWIER